MTATSNEESTEAARFTREEFIRSKELISCTSWDAEKWVSEAARGFPQLSDSIRSSLGLSAVQEILFRGHVDQDWGLHSTLFRALKDALGRNPWESDLAAAERRVIDGARRPLGVPQRSQGSRLGLNLTDGDLLAVLQHHGCPTRFLDVSEDASVGLFFACEKEDSIDGRIFLIALRPREVSEVDSFGGDGEWLVLNREAKLPWAGVASAQYSDGLWTQCVFRAVSDKLDPRMSAQKGSFLVGGTMRSYGNMNMNYRRLQMHRSELQEFACFPINLRGGFRRIPNPAWPAYAWTLRVPASLKREIRRLLALQGIDEESVYPDFEAYRQLSIEEARRI